MLTYVMTVYLIAGTYLSVSVSVSTHVGPESENNLAELSELKLLLAKKDPFTLKVLGYLHVCTCVYQ